MTIPTNTYTTYTVKGMKEDFRDFISNISPTDTVFQNMVGSTSVHNKYFQWQIDTLRAPAANAKIEADAYAADAAVPTAEVGNTQQISWVNFIVSGSNDATGKYGRGKEVAYQLIKVTKELKRDMEFNLVGNVAAVAGNTTTARKTSGLECWFTTNVSRGAGGSSGGFTAAPGAAAPTDGTARNISESLISAVLLSAYNAGGSPNTLMVPPKHKQYLSTVLTGGNTRMVDADEKKLYAAVDVYDSDFGQIKIVPNRFQRYTAGSVNGAAFLLDADLWKIAYLRPIQVDDAPVAADVAAWKVVKAEYGLMSINEAGSGIVADLS